jgi:pyruvate-formate lyase-activating enzyme
MNFDEYQAKATTTSTLTDNNIKPLYFTLGLTGEAGEIAEKIKKIIRNHDGDFSKLDLDDIKKRFEFIKSLGPAVKRVDVLKYHTLGEGKYYSLGMEYPIAPGTVCSDEFIDKVSEIADMVGVPINIEN